MAIAVVPLVFYSLALAIINITQSPLARVSSEKATATLQRREEKKEIHWTQNCRGCLPQLPRELYMCNLQWASCVDPLWPLASKTTADATPMPMKLGYEQILIWNPGFLPQDSLRLHPGFIQASFLLLEFIQASLFKASFVQASFFKASFFQAFFFQASFFQASFFQASVFLASVFLASFLQASFLQVSFFQVSFFQASSFQASSRLHPGFV